MFRRFLSVSMAILLMQVAITPLVAANTKAEKEARFSEKVKTNIAKLGTGTDARVEVKLRDNRKLKGYIQEVNDQQFIVVAEKTGVANVVAYPQVKSVKGNNLSNNAKIAIGLGVAAAILIIFFAVLVGQGDRT